MASAATPPATSGAPGAHRASSLLLVFGSYLLLAMVATYPLVTQAGSHVFGLGTPPLNVWAMAWDVRQLLRDPLHLFDGNVFYPYSDTLAFSEHLFVPALMGAPVALATGNYVLAHNVVALLTLALAGLGMYLLAFEVARHRGAAFAAGVLYAFHTWNINELIRIQILSNEWFPFLLWALVRYFRAPSWRRASAAGLFYALQALSCMYWALYAPILTGLAVLSLAWRHRLAPKRLVRLGVGLGLGLLVTVPFYLPYVETARQWAFSRSRPDPMGILRYLSVLPGNILYPGLPTAGINSDAAHFLGFFALALALVGIVAARPRPVVGFGRVFLVALVVLGFLLSLGPRATTGFAALASGPYRLLYDYVPGFQNVRYPERFSVFVVLGLAPLVALGLARLAGRRSWLAYGAGGALLLEHLAVPLALAPLPTGAAVPQVYRWLARQEDVKVVAEVPGARYLNERSDAAPMYFSTIHWKRTVQGFTGYFPPAYNFIRWRLHHFPEPETIAFLEGFGVDTLITRAAPGAACPSGPWELRAGPFEDGACVLHLRPNGQLLVPAQPDSVAASLVELDRGRFALSAFEGLARLAVDGDPSTSWSTQVPQQKAQGVGIRFEEPVAVARVVIDVPPPFEFPIGLRLVGEAPDGTRREIPFDEAAALDRLWRLLLYNPREARLVLDLPHPLLRSLTLRVRENDTFYMPWTMSELHVFTTRARP